MCPTEQSVRVRRKVAFRSRDCGPEGIGVEARTGIVSATEVSGYADILPDVQVGGRVPAVRMPSAVGASELIAAVDFRQWLLAAKGAHRSQAEQYGNADKFSHHSPLVNDSENCTRFRFPVGVVKPGLVEPIPRYGFLPGARGMFFGFPNRIKSPKRVRNYSLS